LAERERFFRFEDLPKGLDDELIAAAQALKLPVKRAVAGLLRGIGELDGALLGGQIAAAAPDSVTGGELVNRGVHLPSDLWDDLTRIAKATGVRRGALGRLILIGHQGRVKELIIKGLGQMADGAGKEEAA
jgi:hypothetical protein